MDISAISKKNSPKNLMIYHEDPQALHIGTLPKHCYFIPFAPGEDSFSTRENSSRFKLLNGEWDFSYYDSIIDMEDDFTVLPGSEKMPVPSNWQLHGHDKPQNVRLSAQDRAEHRLSDTLRPALCPGRYPGRSLQPEL